MILDTRLYNGKSFLLWLGFACVGLVNRGVVGPLVTSSEPVWTDPLLLRPSTDGSVDLESLETGMGWSCDPIFTAFGAFGGGGGGAEGVPGAIQSCVQTMFFSDGNPVARGNFPVFIPV